MNSEQKGVRVYEWARKKACLYTYLMDWSSLILYLTKWFVNNSTSANNSSSCNCSFHQIVHHRDNIHHIEQMCHHKKLGIHYHMSFHWLHTPLLTHRGNYTFEVSNFLLCNRGMLHHIKPRKTQLSCIICKNELNFTFYLCFTFCEATVPVGFSICSTDFLGIIPPVTVTRFHWIFKTIHIRFNILKQILKCYLYSLFIFNEIPIGSTFPKNLYTIYLYSPCRDSFHHIWHQLSHI